MSRASRAKKRKQIMPPVAEPAPAPALAEPKRTPAVRLVIRARIIPDAPPQPTRAASVRPAPVVMALGAVVLIAIIAFTVRLFSGPSMPASASNAAADSAASDQTANTPAPAAQTPAVAASSDSAAPPPQPATSISTASVNEVIPDVPQSALQTIRGTIRVSIEVQVAADGTVTAASARIPGPSRYFQRLALEAARKWTFTPSEQTARTQQVIFSFTRQGASARWE